MFWSNFLHFYQPPNQQKDILDRIVNESYRPLMNLFRDNPQAKATININGGLLELLEENGYKDVINDINELLKRGQIELTGSAKYHAFLPLLPENEVRRQIEINEETLRRYFGDASFASNPPLVDGGWKKKGFFPPELAYDFNLARIVKEMGYEWIVASQIAYPPEADKLGKPQFNKVYKVKGLSDFKIFFRHKQASVLILSGITRSVDSFFAELDVNILNANYYILTIMDAETFGHHRPGLQGLLFEFYKKGGETLQPILVSDLPKYFQESFCEVAPRASTWSNEEQDFWLDKEKKVAAQSPFLLWKDPNNPIHKLQWEFLEFVLRTFRNEKLKIKNEKLKKVQDMLDKALSSDQFWWASAKPWWSLEMIEAGAKQLVQVIETLCMSIVNKEVKQRRPFQFSVQREDGRQKILKMAYSYYRQILDLAFEWQRTGKIRQAHKEAQGEWKDIPFKMRAPAEWYNQVVLEFEDEMKKASQNLEFEKAIKWRDAVIKLKEGTDIYDVLHVVDELYSVRKIPSVKPFLEHKQKEFSEFAKEHFLSLEKDKNQN